MISTLTIIHVIVCVLLIVTVLLQFGKGAETGLLDAASQGTNFGPKGNFLSRTTTILVILFLGLCVGLANLRGKATQSSLLEKVSTPKAPILNSDAVKPSETQPTTEGKEEAPTETEQPK